MTPRNESSGEQRAIVAGGPRPLVVVKEPEDRWSRSRGVPLGRKRSKEEPQREIKKTLPPDGYDQKTGEPRRPRPTRPTRLEPVYESGGDKLKADLQEALFDVGPQATSQAPRVLKDSPRSDTPTSEGYDGWPYSEPIGFLSTGLGVVFTGSPFDQPTGWDDIDELAERCAALVREGKMSPLPSWQELIYRNLKRNPESKLLQSDDALWWVWSHINKIRRQRELERRRIANLLARALRRLEPPTRQQRQAQIIEATRVYEIVGSYRKTEELTGIPKSTIHDWRNREH